MDHPLAYSDAIVRPWRTATLVAVAVASVELLLLIVVGGALLARDTAGGAGSHARPAPKSAAAAGAASRPAPTAPAARAELPRARTRVLVLNGNGRQGAAATTASRAQHRGYRIGGVANAPRMDYTRTLVMYRRGFEGEGRRLAGDLGIAIVGPLDGLRPAQLDGSHVVVVVGS